MTMKQFADHILAVSHEHELPITNLQLQKVMYFSFQKAVAENLINMNIIEENYDEPFQVWKYGPVIKSVYEKYNIYSGNPIVDNGKKDKHFISLDSGIVELLNDSPFALVNKSHAEPFWEHNKHFISGFRSNVNYKIGDIISGYK